MVKPTIVPKILKLVFVIHLRFKKELIYYSTPIGYQDFQSVNIHSTLPLMPPLNRE